MIATPSGAHASTTTRLLVLVVTIAGATLLSARPTMAQTPEARWHVSGDLGLQTTTLSSVLTDPIPFERFVEPGEIVRSAEIDRQPTVHIAASVPVWRNLGLRFGFSQFTRNDDLQLKASIPHPLFFDRHRTISQPTVVVQRERSVDLHASWMVLRGDRVAFSVFGGPTVHHTLLEIDGVQTIEVEYPFAAPPVNGIVRFERRPIDLGYGVGADLAVFFSRHVGVGWLVRYARASSNVKLPEQGFFPTLLDRPVTNHIKVGGAIVAGGLRFRF